MQTPETRIWDILTRHTIKVKKENRAEESPDYPGISKVGVKLARKTALSFILPEFIKAPRGTVICLGGVTNEIRTLSTNRVYYDILKKWLLEREIEGIDFIDRENTGDKYNPPEVSKKINSDPETKFLTQALLQPPEFSTALWQNSNLKDSVYLKDLEEGNERKFMDGWLRDYEEGKGFHPTPEEDAKSFYSGLVRIENFVRKYIPGRNAIIVTVAHTFELNSFIGWSTFPDNIRKGYEQTTGSIPFEPAEPMIFDKTGNMLIFRGKSHQLNLAA